MKNLIYFVVGAIAASLVNPFLGGASTRATSPLIASPADLKERISTELHITRPDYIVFKPEVTDTTVSDTGNEHFLVFDGPEGSLMAVWTQSSAEAQPDQHIAFARSGDEGLTWSQPRIIAGPRKPGDGHMASEDRGLTRVLCPAVRGF